WLSPHLILQGPPDSGKTHLAHLIAAATGSQYLAPAQTADLTDLAGAYVVDDADLASEEALFHLSNHASTSGQPLVLTTKIRPVAWQTQVPDLASRLRAMRLIVLPEPDDALLVGVLKNLFARRTISPSDDTLAYLAARMDRSIPAAQKIVTELEYYANGRAFNKALVRDFLEQSETLFDDPEV
ncbi:MAG: chromosomal replication initiator DnaA, partial [Asticcacaulis sp.]|nr:chromosomal replication initiator DnaA [Asticcacaulis sp.]